VRLFIAINIAPPVRAELAALIDRWKATEPRARWVRAEGIHITLKFLGETHEEKVPEIRSALSTIRSSDPVEIHVRGLGFFPNAHRPRVLWAGVEASSNLAGLARTVEGSVERLGFVVESRPFQPHLTLARLPEPGKWDALVRSAQEINDLEFGSFCESEFHLIQSFLKPSGAEYKSLASFPFVKETA